MYYATFVPIKRAAMAQYSISSQFDTVFSTFKCISGSYGTVVVKLRNGGENW